MARETAVEFPGRIQLPIHEATRESARLLGIRIDWRWRFVSKYKENSNMRLSRGLLLDVNLAVRSVREGCYLFGNYLEAKRIGEPPRVMTTEDPGAKDWPAYGTFERCRRISIRIYGSASS